jgi:hypothetical protein
MFYDIRFEKAMEMLNEQLQEMKAELAEVEELSVKGDKKKMVKRMQLIYKQLEEMVDKYSDSHEQDDLNSACRMLEVFQPSFVLNYNEICYDRGLELLNKTLDEMADELEELELMGLTGIKEERVRLMEEIYDDLTSDVDKYAHSHDHADFERALKRIEQQKPEFTLAYRKLRS